MAGSRPCLAHWRWPPLHRARLPGPLPTPDWQGTCGLRATYTDACWLSRALLERLPQASGEVLLLPGACPFWTEHGDRSGCTSWLAALGVDAETRGFLGRWAVKDSADSYVRSAPRVVENLQILATRFARLSLGKGPDFFGEEDTLLKLDNFLQHQGVEDHEREWQLKALTTADATLPIPSPTARGALLHREGLLVEGAAEATEIAAVGEDAPAALETELPTTPGADEAAADRAQDCRHRLAAEPPATGFVTSISASGFRRLHLVGACRLVPGEHYHNYTMHGDTLPNPEGFHARCRWCFPVEEALVEDDVLPSNSSSSSSSSDSSSES